MESTIAKVQFEKWSLRRLRSSRFRPICSLSIQPRNSTIQCLLLYGFKMSMLAFPMRPSPGLVSSQACANCSAVPPRPLSLSIETVVRARMRAQFARPLFSWSYKSFLPQTLCVQILTKHPGVSPSVAFVPRTQHSLCCASSYNSCVVSNLPALGFSCRSFSRSSPLFSIACGLFCRIPGGGVPVPGTRLLQARIFRSATWTRVAHPTIITVSSRFQVHG
jgi:hypothetical protein